MNKPLIYSCLLSLLLACSVNKSAISAVQLTDQEIVQIAETELGLAGERLARVDQDKFKQFVSTLVSEGLRNDLYQPLQFRYYDSLGSLQVLYANCDVPYKKQKGDYVWYWNQYGTFDSYPPVQPVSKPYIKGLNLSEELDIYVALTEGAMDLDLTFPTIVVFWSHNLMEQSTNLINLTRNLEREANVNMLYVHVE